MNLPMRLSSETLAIMMIGDGVLSMVRPRKHVSLWRRAGPEPWQNLVGVFEDRPRLMAALGAISVAAGLWLAFRAEDDVI
jgi:hypothetical protein